MEDRLKAFRAWDVMDGRREIFSPEDSLPEDDLVFFLLELIPGLDLSPFHEDYSKDLRGQPPFSVAMRTVWLVYSYSVGVFSSRKIAAACERNLAFLAIVGNDRPDFRTISDFRKNHQAAMKALFLEVLRVAGELGMVQLGNLSTDGTKIEAHASRHKAMSYGYMTKDLERLQAEIDKLLESADRTDAEQDAALGSRRGDELPDELKRREDRVAKIQAAKARLEAEAQSRAETEQRERDAATAQREAEGKSRRGKQPAPIDATPDAKAQMNFTDPDAKIMKRSNKGFDYCYNAQAVVDSAHQIIVAAEATTAANDKQQAVPLAKAALENLTAAGIEWPRDEQGQPRPIPNTADSGYFSEANVRDVTALGLDPYYATGRQRHHAPEEAALPEAAPAATETAATEIAATEIAATEIAATEIAATEIAAKEIAAKEIATTEIAAKEIATTETPKEAMAAKLRTELGRKLYAARKHIVEPVFGQIKRVRGFRKFSRRGLELIRAEWQLICATHNLLKIWRFTFSSG